MCNEYINNVCVYVICAWLNKYKYKGHTLCYAHEYVT